MSHSRTRARRILTRVRAAAVLAGLLTLTFLAGAASVGALRTAPAPAPVPQTHTVTARQDDTVTAYNAGWEAGVAALRHGVRPAYPDVVAAVNDWADGWIDGQADALGDDNRDGVVNEGESGWDCHTMGNRRCAPAAARARH